MLNNSKASLVFALETAFTAIATKLALASLPFKAVDQPTALGSFPCATLSPLNLGLPGHESISGFQIDLMVENIKGGTTDEGTADDICQQLFEQLHLLSGQPGSCWISQKDFSKPGNPHVGWLEMRTLTGWGPGGFNSRPGLIHRRIQIEIQYRNF